MNTTAPVCRRCAGYIPNNDCPGEYPGALSRTDNRTEVCSACGHAEAIEDFLHGAPAPQSDWLLPPTTTATGPVEITVQFIRYADEWAAHLVDPDDRNAPPLAEATGPTRNAALAALAALIDLDGGA